jgi:hypothetical protein
MGKLIYAILSNKADSEKINALLSGMKGIADADFAAISFDQISAVVSDIEKAGLIANQANAFAFAKVIEILEKQYPLLPMRFGSIMESPASVLQMLERNYPEFQNNLQKVENKSEFGLKIFCDSEKVKESLRSKSAGGNSSPIMPEPEPKKSVYIEYVNKKLAEHRLEELLVSYVDSIIAEFTGKLTQWNAESKIKKMASASILVDAVFLLKKDMESQLVQEITDLQSRHPELNYTLTGPWPPYSFVDVTIK